MYTRELVVKYLSELAKEFNLFHSVNNEPCDFFYLQSPLMDAGSKRDLLIVIDSDNVDFYTLLDRTHNDTIFTAGRITKNIKEFDAKNTRNLLVDIMKQLAEAEQDIASKSIKRSQETLEVLIHPEDYAQ